MRSPWVPRLIVAIFGIACLLATVMLSHLALARHAGGVQPDADDPLAPLYALPEFQLTDQRGHNFGSADLRGHVWVAHFFFSRCNTVCPAVTGQMARLQMFLDEHRLSDVRMVSFTVDPENDTVKKLAAYADRLDVQPDRWTLVTGERGAIWSLVENGFKLAVEQTEDPEQPVSHAASLVLIDAQGRVRSYYHNMDDPTEAQVNFARLVSDLSKLRREP